jgi:hypothetical protein
MIASQVAAFAVQGVPSGTVYRRLLDSGAAALGTQLGIRGQHAVREAGGRSFREAK